MQPNNHNFSGNFNTFGVGNGYQIYGQPQFAPNAGVNAQANMAQGGFHNHYPVQGMPYQQFVQGVPMSGMQGMYHAQGGFNPNDFQQFQMSGMPQGTQKPQVPQAPVQQKPTKEDKHQRYKLEQQQKFRNFGKSFKSTSINSMLDNIVNVPTKKPVASPKQEADDFGDFLQAPVSSVPPSGQSSKFDSMTAEDIISNNINPDQIVETKLQSQPPGKEVDLQSKMMASLDLNAPTQASRKFKPSLVDITAKSHAKTFQSSVKSANWSHLSVEKSDFYVATEVSHNTHQVVEPPALNTQENQGYQPLWLSDPSRAPLVYNQVMEACRSPDDLMDTNKLYTILLKSNLSNDVLGQLWTLANTSVPGRLNQTELYILLALIALTQKGQVVSSWDIVQTLHEPPVPNFNVNQPSHTHAAKHNLEPNIPVTLPQKDDDEFDDFQEFQSIGGNITHDNNQVTETTFNSSAPFQDFPKPPSKDSKSVTMESIQNISSSLQSFHSDPKKFQDMDSSSNAFSAFKSFPQAEETSIKAQSNATDSSIIIPQPGNDEDKYSAFNDISFAQSSFPQASADSETLKQDLPSNDISDRYSDFQAFQQTPQQFLSDSNSTQSQPDANYPPTNPPGYDSLFNAATEISDVKQTGVSTIDVQSHSDDFGDFASVSASNNDIPFVQSTQESFHDNKKDSFSANFDTDSINDDDFKVKPVTFSNAPTVVLSADTSSNSKHSDKNIVSEVSSVKPELTSIDRFSALKVDTPFKSDSFSLKSDTNSVKSLELTSLSHSIAQASLGTSSLTKDSTQDVSIPTIQPNMDYGFDDGDGYDDLAMPPEVPDAYEEEFDVFQSNDHSTLAAFDAFEDVTEKRGRNDLPSLPSIPDSGSDIVLSPTLKSVEEPEEFSDSPPEQDFSEEAPQNPDPSFEKSSPSELEKRLVETLTGSSKALPTPLDAVNLEECVNQWEKCLSHCYNIIASSNEILSSIQSPAVCMEVVNSSSGIQFIADLKEVYKVSCKIFQSATALDLQKETVKHLHKQIQLTWNNLIAFCPSAQTDDFDEHAEDDADSCGICLLPIQINKITYGGSHYHGPCANFYINCVASILPALRVG